MVILMMMMVMVMVMVMMVMVVVITMMIHALLGMFVNKTFCRTEADIELIIDDEHISRWVVFTKWCEDLRFFCSIEKKLHSCFLYSCKSEPPIFWLNRKKLYSCFLSSSTPNQSHQFFGSIEKKLHSCFLSSSPPNQSHHFFGSLEKKLYSCFLSSSPPNQSHRPRQALLFSLLVLCSPSPYSPNSHPLVQIHIQIQMNYKYEYTKKYKYNYIEITTLVPPAGAHSWLVLTKVLFNTANLQFMV